jgi:hypothetical protein
MRDLKTGYIPGHAIKPRVCQAPGPKPGFQVPRKSGYCDQHRNYTFIYTRHSPHRQTNGLNTSFPSGVYVDRVVLGEEAPPSRARRFATRCSVSSSGGADGSFPVMVHVLVYKHVCVPYMLRN